jgi:lysozyme family protein
MVSENFERALSRVLKYEGGFSDHPSDPGGPTMKGVIQRVYDAYREQLSLPKRSVRHISEIELREIYRRQYWDRIRGDKLPGGVDFVVFDGAVNSGPAQSTKWLQRALGVTADGDMGVMTVNAALAADPSELVDSICDQRLTFLKRLKTWPVFGKGWGARVADVRNVGSAWAEATAPEPTPLPAPSGSGKAPAPEQEEKPAVKSSINWAAIGAFLASVGGLLTDWRVLAVIITGALAGYIVWARSGKPDVTGWLKS